MCGDEAKLFYLPRDSDDIKNMTDTSGRLYSRLPTAFAYRKSLINGCSCKPMPWSLSETARHGQYALIEALDKAQERNAELARVASAASDQGEITSATIAARNAEAIDLTPLTRPASESSEPLTVAATVAALETDTLTSDGAAEPLAVLGHLMPAGFDPGIPVNSAFAAPAQQRVRKSIVTGALKPSVRKSTQTASWFTAQPKYSWPGDVPARRR